MNNWRDIILKEFTPHIAKITVVVDKDALLSEEVIIQEIQTRGFELVVYEEPISFRYLYESKYHSLGDKELIILLRHESNRFESLPYDILHSARRLTISLHQIFPQMNRNVLTQLDRSLLDKLYEAQIIYSPHQLSENATKDFVLRHVFEIAPEMIKTPPDLLRMLLRKHYREQKVPLVLDEWLIQSIRRDNRFSDWALESIIPERGAFFTFLQERWLGYLHSIEPKQAHGTHDSTAVYHTTYYGPAILPFEHDDIRVYMDNLFAERLLKPEKREGFDLQHYPAWIKMGIRRDVESERHARLQRIFEMIDVEFPSQSARHTEWLNLAQRWAEANALWYKTHHAVNHKPLYEPLLATYETLQRRIDESFMSWVNHSYGSLYSLPVDEPVMLHHIPRYLSKRLQPHTARIALVIIDGMSYAQWVVIRDTLQQQLKGYQISVSGIFAWIPTLTSISRQALFAGKPPMFFPNHVWDTQKEEALWIQFWSDAGLAEHQVYYRRITSVYEKKGKLGELRDEIAAPQIRIAGLVLDKVDKIMHGMELGAAGMINQVRQWAEQGTLAQMLRFLVDNQYQVWLSSDHGNIEAIGCGSPNEGAVADLRGERVRIYPNEALRSSVKANYSQAIEWKAVGLPENYYPLIASKRTAFVQQDKHTVCHGGISLEEVIVPLVRIEK